MRWQRQLPSKAEHPHRSFFPGLHDYSREACSAAILTKTSRASGSPLVPRSCTTKSYKLVFFGILAWSAPSLTNRCIVSIKVDSSRRRRRRASRTLHLSLTDERDGNSSRRGTCFSEVHLNVCFSDGSSSATMLVLVVGGYAALVH